jgi:pyrroloquinoline-quinone synthase
MMNEGRLAPAQIRGWVANRFYYQFSIPMKDGAILSNCPDREVRRAWIQRILDQDGSGGEPGGLEAWIRLGEACGIGRAELTSLRLVLPAVRFAVDAYVNFARTRPWQEAVCSSLTELFAPQARDVEHALSITLEYFTTREMQERALEILQFKLDILWALLDAVQTAYK